MKPVLNWIIYNLLIAPLLALTLLVSIVRLYKTRIKLRQADHVVVIPDGGFGQIIAGPDTARRLFVGENTVCIIFERNQHNTLVGSLWPDISVVFIPLIWRLNLLVLKYAWELKLPAKNKLGAWLIKWLGKRLKAEVIHLEEVYDRACDFGVIESAAAQYTSHHIVGRTHLINSVEVPEARLPAETSAMIRTKIQAFSEKGNGNHSAKLCCLYVRGKGLGSRDLTSSRRTGSDLETYLPSIELLIKSGYVVLLTGDHVLDRSHQADYDNKLVCAKWAGVDSRLFSLFAATDSDIWIGNLGGGTPLPCTTKIPKLAVEIFPFGAGIPNSTLYFKTVQDSSGELVHYSKLFRDHVFDYDMPGWTVQNNTSEQLTAAVSSFLEELDQPKVEDEAEQLLKLLPDHFLSKHVNGRISPAWLRIFESSEAVVN